MHKMYKAIKFYKRLIYYKIDLKIQYFEDLFFLGSVLCSVLFEAWHWTV